MVDESIAPGVLSTPTPAVGPRRGRLVSDRKRLQLTPWGASAPEHAAIGHGNYEGPVLNMWWRSFAHAFVLAVWRSCSGQIVLWGQSRRAASSGVLGEHPPRVCGGSPRVLALARGTPITAGRQPGLQTALAQGLSSVPSSQ